MLVPRPCRLLTALLLLLLPALAVCDDVDELEPARAVAQRYCLPCHSSGAPSGGVDLEKLLLHDPYAKTAHLKRVLTVLRNGEMPPAVAPQPATDDRAAFLSSLEVWLRAHRPRDPAEGHVYTRRLTRAEYSHTLRDLLGLPADPFFLPEQFARYPEYFKPETGEMAPTIKVAHWQSNNNPPLTRYPGITTLPADSRAEHGFANQGDQISLSPALLEKYFAVASDLINHKLFPADHPLFSAPALDATDPVETARERLAAFLPQAFRRPVSREEIERYLAIFIASRRAGADFTTAAKNMIIGALSSPYFLMRIENAGVAADYETASRLSYFLWTSMPDQALLEAAAAGRLGDPDGLEREARRMLSDRKVKALPEYFGGPWMRLSELAAIIPDPNRFPGYYDAGGVDRRRTAGLHMMLEALLLFETILVENRGVTEFLDADFTYVNHYLAELYGLERCGGDIDTSVSDYKEALLRQYPTLSMTWKRCKLDDRRRGGVLTLGSTLTLTSLPTRSSPIARGALLSDVIFNRPPSPPPPGVPPLPDRDESALLKLTLRRQLAAHRDNPGCSNCHDRMDPLGFALENYNAIGQWRDEEEAGLAIDASGQLAGGLEFDGIETFKDALLARPELFVRAFVEQLMAYALGRELTVFDDPAVSDILERTRPGGHCLQDIVVAIALSEPFRQTHTRSAPAASEPR